MKLSSHPRFHVCPSRTLRQLKVLSPPFAQSETQPTTAFFSVAGCSTSSARLLSAHIWGGLLSLYFVLRVVPLPSAHSNNCVRRVKTFCLPRNSENYPSTHSGE